MSDILLINPPYTRYGQPVEIQADEPLGLLCLTAYLMEQGKTVEIFDAFQGKGNVIDEGQFYWSGLSREEIKNKIQEVRPSIVGITSMFTMHSKGAHDVAKIVKEVIPQALVVLGGSHPSALPDWVLQDTNVDVVVIGEGELTFMEVLEKYEIGEDISTIPGTAVRKNGCVITNPDRPFIENLDSLPLPARDRVDMNIYLHEPYRTQFAMRPPRLNIMTTRGCTGRCVFCSIHSIWRHRCRMFSAGRTVDEIEILVKKYGAREIAFLDDDLISSKSRMKEICKEIIRRKLNIKWCTPNGVAVWKLDEELLDLMRASGLYKITFGIDTASKETQKFIHKTHLNLDKAKKVIEYCNRIGMWTHASFIIGFPYETKADIETTIRYAVESDLDFAAFFIATPFPGTPLYEIYKTEGLFPDFGDGRAIKWEGSQQIVMTDTHHFKKEELQDYLREAHRRFYHSRVKKFLNPMRILRKIRGRYELRYFLRLMKMARGELSRVT